MIAGSCKPSRPESLGMCGFPNAVTASYCSGAYSHILPDPPHSNLNDYYKELFPNQTNQMNSTNTLTPNEVLTLGRTIEDGIEDLYYKLQDATERAERAEQDAVNFNTTLRKLQDDYRNKLSQEDALNAKLVEQIERTTKQDHASIKYLREELERCEIQVKVMQQEKEVIETNANTVKQELEKARIQVNATEHLAKQVVRLQTENVQLRTDVLDTNQKNALRQTASNQLALERKENERQYQMLDHLRARNIDLEKVNDQLNTQTPRLIEENRKFQEQTTRLVEEKRLLTEQIVRMECAGARTGRIDSLCGSCLSCQLKQAQYIIEQLSEDKNKLQKEFNVKVDLAHKIIKEKNAAQEVVNALQTQVIKLTNEKINEATLADKYLKALTNIIKRNWWDNAATIARTALDNK